MYSAVQSLHCILAQCLPRGGRSMAHYETSTAIRIRHGPRAAMNQAVRCFVPLVCDCLCMYSCCLLVIMRLASPSSRLPTSPGTEPTAQTNKQNAFACMKKRQRDSQAQRRCEIRRFTKKRRAVIRYQPQSLTGTVRQQEGRPHLPNPSSPTFTPLFELQSGGPLQLAMCGACRVTPTHGLLFHE
jgi:hypothetical protein